MEILHDRIQEEVDHPPPPGTDVDGHGHTRMHGASVALDPERVFQGLHMQPVIEGWGVEGPGVTVRLRGGGRCWRAGRLRVLARRGRGHGAGGGGRGTDPGHTPRDHAVLLERVA